MFLSVIIPVYNVEPYLRNCIDSVIKQDLRDKIELLLIDDGSKDSSGKICDEYATKYPWIKVYHLPNGGVSRARNFGLEHASGEYFTFIDSDDFLDENIYAEIYQAYTKNPTDMYFFGYKDFPKSKTSHSHIPTQTLYLTTQTLSNAYLEMKKDYMMFPVINKVFKRSICGNIRFQTDLHYFEDYLFALSCLNKIHTLTAIGKAPYNYVHYPGEHLGGKYTSPEIITHVAQQILGQSLSLPQNEALTHYTTLEYYNNLLHAIDNSRGLKEQKRYITLLVSEIRRYGLLQEFRMYLGRRKFLLMIPKVPAILIMHKIRSLILKLR